MYVYECTKFLQCFVLNGIKVNEAGLSKQAKRQNGKKRGRNTHAYVAKKKKNRGGPPKKKTNKGTEALHYLCVFLFLLWAYIRACSLADSQLHLDCV